MKDVKSPALYVTKMVEAMLESQYFARPVAIIVKKHMEKAVEVKSKRQDRRRWFVKATCGIGAGSASSSDGPLTKISDKPTKEKDHLEISEELEPELSL